MKRFEPLIRLHRWQLNERRRQLAELETAAEATRDRISSLDAMLAAEAREADRDPLQRAAFPTYAEAMRKRRAKLVETLDMLTASIAEAREGVTDAFQELKKYELAQEARRRRDDEASARRERILLDEMAIEGYRRNRAAE